MATNTKNFKFKKPDESDFYDVQDQNGNWDMADEELEKLNTPTFEDYSGSTSLPEASSAIDGIKSGFSLPTLLSNIKAAFKGACLLGHIVNNCVTNRSDLPLSAAQGKVLMDMITKLNGDLGTAKNDLSGLKSKKYIVSTRNTTVNLSKSLAQGAYVDVKTTFTSVDGIIPIPVLKATGWFCGGVEIQNITATSMTVRFLNSNQTTQSGGYANYILLFIK